MSTITTTDVQHLAQLSNIQLSAQEAAALTIDIENILTYVDMLGELDTEGVTPTYQVNDLHNAFRDDTVDPGNVTRADLLALAPETLENHVKVPKVL